MDDGPSNDVTAKVIPQLIANKIPVTFFEIGISITANTSGVSVIQNALQQHPELFSVAIHTWHHWNSSDIMINYKQYNSGYDANCNPAKTACPFVNAADAAPYIGLTAAQIMALEITRTSDLIFNTYGVHPRYFRPPYGEINFGAMDVVNAEELYSVVWSIGI